MYASSHTSIYTQLTSMAPTTFPVVYMGGNQFIVFLHMLTIFLYTTFYHTMIVQVGFPFFSTVTTCNLVDTWVPVQLFPRTQILLLS